MMPPLGHLIGKVDFSNFFLSLNGKSYASRSEAKLDHGATLNYGIFPNNVIKSLIVAFAVFLYRAAGKSLDQEARAHGGADHERVPTMRDDYSHLGEALRSLHNATRLDRLRGRNAGLRPRL